MLPPSFLAKSPDGLLGALDLKNTGKNPGEFSSVLSPSIETMDLYLLRNRLCIVGAGPWVAVNTAIVLAAAVAPGTDYFNAAGRFVVPATSTIRVKSIAVRLTRLAADAALTLEYSVFLQRPSSNIIIGLGTAIFGPRPATDLSFIQALALTQYLWMGPGDQLILVPSTTQAAGGTVALHLDLDSMPSG